MNKTKVLFVCMHNQAYNQMAEALLNQLGGDEYEAESAGLEPGNLNSLANEAMKEIGIDISHSSARNVFDLFNQGRSFQFVVTICDAAGYTRCPIFPGLTKWLNWNFEDISSSTGSNQQKLALIRLVRDNIKSAVVDFIKNHHETNF